jgi:hypothetical protein
MGDQNKLIAKKSDPKNKNSLSHIKKSEFLNPLDSFADHILHLQRIVGNQTFLRLSNAGNIQTKLRVGQPGYIYEQEAERLAKQVMKMSDIQLQRQPEEEEKKEEEQIRPKPIVEQSTPLVKRQAEEEEEGEEEEENLQMKASLRQIPEVGPGIESRINVIKGSGQPLPASTRAFFEPCFGYDLDKVRIHTGAYAAETAQELDARAFTIGHHIVFGTGQYAPSTTAGRHTLAHELTHVMQQMTDMSRPRLGYLMPADIPTSIVRRSPNRARRLEAVITVRWIDDDVRFYHRVIGAIDASQGFRGVRRASLWQPFHGPIFRVFRRINRQYPSVSRATRIRLRVVAWFDPTVFHGQLTNASADLEIGTLRQIGLFPRVTRWIFRNRDGGRVSPENRCAWCSRHMLGVIPNASVNGMELRADIAAHVPGATYTMRQQIVSHVGAVHDSSTQTSRIEQQFSNRPDNPSPRAVYLHRAGSVIMLFCIDRPGWPDPRVPQAMFQHGITDVIVNTSFKNWVDVTCRGRTASDPNEFEWHNNMWFVRDPRSSVGFRKVRARSEIEPGP